MSYAILKQLPYSKDANTHILLKYTNNMNMNILHNWLQALNTWKIYSWDSLEKQYPYPLQ